MLSVKSWLRRLNRIVSVILVLSFTFGLTVPTRAQPNTDHPVVPQISVPSYNLPDSPTDYPADPSNNILWIGNHNDLSDVVAAFNSARAGENAQLGTFLKPMVAPSAVLWAQMSEGEKALWLVNEERTARGLAPLHELEDNVNQVAQAFAEWLLANNKFDHDADGSSPYARMDTKPAIAACHDVLGISENLYWQGTSSPDGIPLVVEQSVYWWLYADKGSSWLHRHALLWTPYTENSGPADREGFVGFGHARGSFTNPDNGKTYSYSDMIVMNFFDPCATWVEAVPAPVLPPQTPEPVETPAPPPETHTASGKTTLPAQETVVYQPFEIGTWPGTWDVSDANGATNGDYQWIAAPCNVFAGDYSGMAIGGGTDGLPLSCSSDYPNNARSWMIYGPFSLEDAIGAIAQANIWVYTEANNDELCMMVSTDMNHFSGACFSGNSDGWVEEQLDLSSVFSLGNLLGRGNLYLAFAFFSNASVTRPYGGAYVDNITLDKEVMQPGSALYGVEIASENGQLINTDQNGDYSLAGLSAGQHTLTPFKLGYEFYPDSVTVDLSASDVANLNFIGVPRVALSVASTSIYVPFVHR